MATKTTKSKQTVQAKPKRVAKKQTAAEKRLVTELTNVLPKLDEESLQFLLEQANILLYNLQIDALAQEEAETSSKSNVSKQKVLHDIKIVRGDNSNVYHIICNGKYSMFNDEEMLSIIRICHADDTEREIKSRLYHWFFVERRDFISDNGLSIDDVEFDLLIKTVKKQFKLEMP